MTSTPACKHGVRADSKCAECADDERNGKIVSVVPSEGVADLLRKENEELRQRAEYAEDRVKQLEGKYGNW